MKGEHINQYNDVQDLIDEGIISPTETIIFWGKRGKGKSSLMGKFMSDFMKPKNAQRRIEASRVKCEKLRSADILIEPQDDHIVFCDTFFEDNGFRGEGRRPYEISGLNLGLPNDKYKNIVPPIPYSCIFLDEVQDLYDSHQGSLATFVSKWYELLRQAGVFLGMACQRPIRVAKDIRDLAVFFEVAGMEHTYIRDKLVSTVWTVNIIYENANLERYIDSRDEVYIDRKIKLMFKGDIFECYDPDFFLPMFYKGFENQRFVYTKVERTEFTREGFERYNSKRIIDIPEAFRGKKEKELKKSDGQGTKRARKT